jgi:hypothetical protein
MKQKQILFTVLLAGFFGGTVTLPAMATSNPANTWYATADACYDAIRASSLEAPIYGAKIYHPFIATKFVYSSVSVPQYSCINRPDFNHAYRWFPVQTQTLSTTNAIFLSVGTNAQGTVMYSVVPYSASVTTTYVNGYGLNVVKTSLTYTPVTTPCTPQEKAALGIPFRWTSTQIVSTTTYTNGSIDVSSSELASMEGVIGWQDEVPSQQQ